MRRKPSIFVLLVVALLFGGGAAGGQDSPGAGPKKPRTAEDYKPRTLKELAARAQEPGGRGGEGGRALVHGDLLPSRARVTYAGSSRPLPREKKDALLLWAKLYAGYPEGFAAPYETEMLFKEDGAGHWLAVRKQAVSRFEKELKPGEAVDLYLIRLGAAKLPGGWEGLLLVEEFRKPE